MMINESFTSDDSCLKTCLKSSFIASDSLILSCYDYCSFLGKPSIAESLRKMFVLAAWSLKKLPDAPCLLSEAASSTGMSPEAFGEIPLDIPVSLMV